MKKSWQDHQERSNPLALKAIRWIALHLGRPIARLVLYPISFYFLIFATEQRRASQAYLARVLKHQPTWLDTAKHIHCFAATILDRVYLLTEQFDQLAIEFPDENMPLSYSQQGMGCILLGSHVGSFEILRSYAMKKCPLPVKILMEKKQTPMVVQALNALNPKSADMIITLGSTDSLLQIKEATDEGSAIGILGDRLLGQANEKMVTCQLLGENIELPAAPILIAAALKIPVILFFGIYLGDNRYKIQFELLAETIELSRKNRQEDIQVWMQKYADAIEKQILAHPYNWFNFYDYWQDDK